MLFLKESHKMFLMLLLQNGKHYINMEFTKILKEPNKINKKQISYLKSIIDEFPYLQSSRAVELKALKENDSFKFNSELKITAAYSTINI